jgi:DNA polymerase III sliding clamp (beta) subunit (PCNA family)
MHVEIEMPVAALRSTLQGLGKVVNRSSTLPVLGCVKAILEANGEVSLQATNLEDFATCSLGKIENGKPGELLVPFEEFQKVVKGCRADQFVKLIGSGENTCIRYPIGSSHIDKPVNRIELKEWPEVPKSAEPVLQVTEELKSALKQAFECASDDPSRFVLQGAYLDVEDPKAHYVVATNGRIMFSANSFNLSLKESLIIPDRKFLSWTGFMEDGDCTLGVRKEKETGYVQLKSDHWTFITRQIEGSYPKWKQVVPSGAPLTRLSFNEEAVAFLLNAIPKMPDGDAENHSIQLVIQDNHLVLQSRHHVADNWTTLPVVGAGVVGKSETVALNRRFVIQALKLGLVNLEIHADGKPVIFKEGGKRMVIMPLRREVEPKPEVASKPVTPAEPVSSSETTTSQPVTTTTQPTERISSMSKAATSETKETVQNPNTSAFEQLKTQIETIKETLKGVVGDLNEVLKTVTQAHREKKTTEKEMETIRESLREIQQIKV